MKRALVLRSLIEYTLSNDIDFVAEIGIGLNDDSSNYMSGGIAYYLR